MTHADDLTFLEPIPIGLTVELGRCRMTIAELGALEVDDVIELGRRVNDVLELRAAGLTFASGEVVVVDEQVGLRLTDLPDDASPANG